MVKNKKNLVLFCLTTTIIGASIYSVSANNAEPGSSADPVVTRSYVDEKINELMTVFAPDKSAETNNNLQVTQSDSYKPVRATKGQIIIGNEGSEIILRSGQAIGYCTGVDGVVNATKGTEVFNKDKIEKNNLLIIPRSDGRGVKITSDECWFIIKGGYEIKS